MQASAAYSHSGAITASGRVYTWGSAATGKVPFVRAIVRSRVRDFVHPLGVAGVRPVAGEIGARVSVGADGCMLSCIRLGTLGVGW